MPSLKYPYIFGESVRERKNRIAYVYRLNNEDKHIAALRRSYKKHRVKRISEARGVYWANPERIRAQVKKSRIKIKYGLHDLEAQHKKQNGLCLLCKQPVSLGTRKYAIDHDHTSNSFRGILHPQCNIGLGMFRDSVEMLELAIAYLKSFQN